MKKISLLGLVIAALFAFVDSAAAIPAQLGPPLHTPESGGTFLLLAIALVAVGVIHRKFAKVDR